MKKICYTKEYLKYKRTFVFGQKIREAALKYKWTGKLMYVAPALGAALKYKQLLLCNKMTEIICIWYRNGVQREKKKYT